MVELVAGLEAARADGAPLLPRGIALNVNYPTVAPEQVKGVGIYRHGREIGVNFSDKGALPVSSSGTDRDTSALEAGYITIVPIDGDYTAPNWDQLLPDSLLQDLNS